MPILVSGGFPARAGIDPRSRGRPPQWLGLPRSRGDRPLVTQTGLNISTASPLARGSTRPAWRARSDDLGFPARAGIDPIPPARSGRPGGLPRSRGDRPDCVVRAYAVAEASPLARGSTQSTRAAAELRAGFPARAGIDRLDRAGSWRCSRLPRSRGDRPHSVHGWQLCDLASPLARGSTSSAQPSTPGGYGFPARAGIDPRRAGSRWR